MADDSPTAIIKKQLSNIRADCNVFLSHINTCPQELLSRIKD